MKLDQFKKNNKFLMLAFDHRGSFQKLMNPGNLDFVTLEQEIQLKKEIIDSLRGEFSSLLIVQDTGLRAYEPKDTPFLLPLEKSGFKVQGKDRLTEIEYSVESLKQSGAAGAKLLVFFNPYGKTVEQQIETSKKVLDECKSHNFPCVLEIRTYNDEGLKVDKMDEGEREQTVPDSLKMFLARGIEPDAYILEYPGSALGCQTITAILQEHNPEKIIPWILQTPGDTFENLTKQLVEASIRGCSGFLAGKAVWSDVCSLQGEEKENFLKVVLPERFNKISGIILNV